MIWFLNADSVPKSPPQSEHKYFLGSCVFMCFFKHCVLKLRLQMLQIDKPNTCEVCNKSFRQKGHLQRHQKIHLGERNYQCCYCSKRFTRQEQWSCRTYLNLYSFGHLSHLKVWLFICFLTIWRLNVSAWMNRWEQIPHVKFFSLLCDKTWDFKCCIVKNALGQSPHW
jgi:hypothetical protein